MAQKLSAYIAVEAATYAIDKPYEYSVPESMRDSVKPGVRVRVGFGRGSRRTDGIVLDVHEKKQNGLLRLKPISEVIDNTPVFDEKMIRLALWLKDQCFCTFFDIAKAMLPSGVWHKVDIAYIPIDAGKVSEAKEFVSEKDCGKEITERIFMSLKPYKKQDLYGEFGEDAVDKVTAALIHNGYIEVSEHMTQNISDKTERLVRIGVSREEAEEYLSKKKAKPNVCEAVHMLCDMGAVTSKELGYYTGISTAQINTLKKNGIVSFDSVTVYRRPRPKLTGQKREIVFNEMQQSAYDALSAKIDKGPSCSVLFGVTGSGKTLIYFKLIEKVISLGKTAILLVPEISLTPQLLEQVYAYFGDRTAVMHSALSVGERYDEWKRIKNGEVDVVVGTRSAVFSPLSNLGIIIIDEEQESTYKSSSNPRYHAREAAKFRCVSNSAMLLLGSATPAVESMYNATYKNYDLHILPERYNMQPLPRVIISDLRKSMRQGSDSVIGAELYEELKKNMENGEQSILFLNRRGASKYAVCDNCGKVPECPNCSVPLVYHSKNNRLMCHHCGHSEYAFDVCSNCGKNMRFVGIGTQKAEEELNALFPGVGIVRMDTDTTTGKNSHEELLNKFRNEKIPILLGTQMITKGLDIENVTLVGILSADQALLNENYKASETAFSLMTQVIGRAGRGMRKGRAVVQTYMPKNSIIQLAARQDYMSFLKAELEVRKVRALPPYTDMFSLVVLAENELDALNACIRVKTLIISAIQNEYPELKTSRVLGPTPMAIVKMNGKYRYKLFLLTENNKRSRDLISRVIRNFMNDKKNKNLSIIPDINSTDF